MKNTILIICLGCFFVLACGEQQEASDLTTTTEASESLRMISLSGFLTEVLDELGHLDQVVGRDVTSVHDPRTSEIPNLGHVSQLNAEAILALKPQVIFAEEKQRRQSEVFQQLQDAGINIVFVPTSMHFDNSIKATQVIQQYLATPPEKIQNLKKQIEQDSVKLDALLDKYSERPRVLFIYARGAGRLMVGGKNTAAAAMIEKAGGQNAILSFEDFRALTPEALIEASPEVILMFKSGLESLDGKEGLAQISGIAQTEAYKQDRIIAMDGHYLTAFGIHAGKAALELANQIHQ